MATPPLGVNGLDNRMLMDEPGAAENRLNIRPSDFEGVSEWKDGVEYNITGRVRQVAPGQFEVLNFSGTPVNAETEPVEEEEMGSEGETELPMESEIENPAVSGMARRMMRNSS